MGEYCLAGHRGVGIFKEKVFKIMESGIKDNAIQVKDINFTYDNKAAHMVLCDVSIDVSDGEFIAVLGHNGSGKSTFAKHLNAILLPSGGRVFAYGMDTSDDSLLFEIRQRVGMVFQNPDNQIVATLVEEDIAFAPENLGIERAEIRNRVDEALKAVGMYEYKDHAPHMLSGGQKQRIAIAGCLAMRPRCLVLDEATAMLDPSGRKSVMKTLKRLNEQEGTAIVHITHHMSEAAQAKRVIVMSGGRIILDGEPKQVFSRVEEIRGAGLDLPQTTELMYLLRERGIDVPDDVLTDEECADALQKLLGESI